MLFCYPILYNFSLKVIPHLYKRLIISPIMLQVQPFHLVNSTPWPFLMAWAIFLLTLNLVIICFYPLYFSEIGLRFLKYGHIRHLILTIVFSFFICLIFLWCLDVLNEAVFEGWHTKLVQRGIRLGFILFIISEFMLFFGCFWSLFYTFFYPSYIFNDIWPPIGIKPITPLIPNLNTAILWTSAISVTYVHKVILLNK